MTGSESSAVADLKVHPDDVNELRTLRDGLFQVGAQVQSPAVFEIAQRLRQILTRITGLTE